jgi:hypothetical protein
LAQQIAFLLLLADVEQGPLSVILTWYTCLASMEPSRPNWASTSGLQSALAPTSNSTPTSAFLGNQRGDARADDTGMGLVMKMLPTSIAPVLPVLAKASIFPSFIRWKPMLMLLFGLAWKRFRGVVAHGDIVLAGNDIESAWVAPLCMEQLQDQGLITDEYKPDIRGQFTCSHMAPRTGTTGPWSLPMMSSPILMWRGGGSAR